MTTWDSACLIKSSLIKLLNPSAKFLALLNIGQHNTICERMNEFCFYCGNINLSKMVAHSFLLKVRSRNDVIQIGKVVKSTSLYDRSEVDK